MRNFIHTLINRLASPKNTLTKRRSLMADRRRAYIFLLLVLTILTACTQQEAPQLTVSAAANLIPAFEEIGQSFTANTGIKVVFNFGSSGKLAQQIEQGAPVDLFVSANANYVTRLIDGGVIDASSYQIYALGRIVVWSKTAQLLPQDIGGLNSPDIERIAIANPEHAPYGVIAKTVLQNARLWNALQPKLVTANDVRQTLTYAQTGDVSAALVPLSLVIDLNEGAYSLVPETYHPPITQALGIVSQSSHQAEAQQFIDFILSEEGQAILSKYGYTSP